VAEKKNPFLASTMQVLGGGEARHYEKLRSFERRGGAVDDGYKTLKLLDRVYSSPCPFTFPVAEQAAYIGLTPGCVSPLDSWSALSSMSHNLDANPGPNFKALGFNKKRDSMAVAVEIADLVVEKARSESVIGYLKPRYSLAGRTKLSEKDKFRQKALLGRPFGRAVFMADQHEALIACRYSGPLLDYFLDNFGVVTNGFNKFGDHPTKITDSLEKFDVYVNGDMGAFDVNTSDKLIARSFDVLRHAFSIPRDSGSVDDRLLEWLEDEIIYSEIVLPTGRVIRKHGGIPSGSGLTALLGSIINAMMWQEVLYRLGVGDHSLRVHGDDNLVGLRCAGSHYSRREWGQEMVRKAARLFNDLYGHELSEDKTTVGTNLFVSFAQPRVPAGTNDHSSRVIMSYRSSLRNELGRPLTFDEQFIVLDEEPIGPAPGMTHRWTYVFKGRAKFLSHYFKKDPTSGSTMCVRPTGEVISNLLHPEGRVRHLGDHIERLKSALVENMGNHHVTNHVMHYMYDAFILQKAGHWRRPPNKPIPRRAWYRKIDYQVDLLTEDDEFFRFWRKFEHEARKAHTAVFGGRYADWGEVRALRRGRQRFTIGGPMSRDPGLADYSVNIENPEFVKNLGALGFNLWAVRPLRLEVANRVEAMIRMSDRDMTAEEPLRLMYAINKLREMYAGDFM